MPERPRPRRVASMRDRDRGWWTSAAGWIDPRARGVDPFRAGRRRRQKKMAPSTAAAARLLPPARHVGRQAGMRHDACVAAPPTQLLAYTHPIPTQTGDRHHSGRGSVRSSAAVAGDATRSIDRGEARFAAAARPPSWRPRRPHTPTSGQGGSCGCGPSRWRPRRRPRCRGLLAPSSSGQQQRQHQGQQQQHHQQQQGSGGGPPAC